MFRNVQIVLGALAAILFGLSALSRRLPHVAWLQHFRFENRLSEAQKARVRRRANITAGFELILLGVVLPLGYVILTVAFFNALTTRGITLVLAASLACIALGITAIVRSRR